MLGRSASQSLYASEDQPRSRTTLCRKPINITRCRSSSRMRFSVARPQSKAMNMKDARKCQATEPDADDRDWSIQTESVTNQRPAAFRSSLQSGSLSVAQAIIPSGRISAALKPNCSFARPETYLTRSPCLLAQDLSEAFLSKSSSIPWPSCIRSPIVAPCSNSKLGTLWPARGWSPPRLYCLRTPHTLPAM